MDGYTSSMSSAGTRQDPPYYLLRVGVSSVRTWGCKTDASTLRSSTSRFNSPGVANASVYMFAQVPLDASATRITHVQMMVQVPLEDASGDDTSPLLSADKEVLFQVPAQPIFGGDRCYQGALPSRAISCSQD
jgi:hypothetical protein